MAFSFRPSFALDLELPSSELVEHLARGLSTMPLQLRRTRVPGGGPSSSSAPRDRDSLVVTVLPEARHFWSPWLVIEVDPRERNAHLSATFSPHPSVWTAYMFGYLGLGIVLLFSLLYAGSVWMMGGDQLWSLWIAGAAIASMIAMWWVSIVGQRLAATQMAELRSALTQTIEQVRATHATPPG